MKSQLTFAERLACLEQKDQEMESRISSLERRSQTLLKHDTQTLKHDTQTLMHIKVNQMKVLRRSFLNSFRKDFQMKGHAPMPLELWNDWVSGLDADTSVRGLTKNDLELTLVGKRLGEHLGQNIGGIAAREADVSQTAIALDFFMSTGADSRRWDNLFRAMYGVSVKDAIASLG